MTGWVEQAHGFGDDLVTDEQTMLIELAAVVYDWPVRDPVVETALHKAAMTLLIMADDAASPHVSQRLPSSKQDWVGPRQPEAEDQKLPALPRR